MIHPSYADLMNVVNSNVEEGEQPVEELYEGKLRILSEEEAAKKAEAEIAAAKDASEETSDEDGAQDDEEAEEETEEDEN